MNRRETATVMAILKAAYPAYYRDISREDADVAVNLWMEMFLKDSYEDVCAAVKLLIATKIEGYPPTIGEVREKLAQLRHPEELNAQEAWALAAKAAAGNLPWDKLPPLVQRAIGSKQVLQDWGMIDVNTFNTVIYSQFIKVYGIFRQRENSLEALPSDIRNVLSGLANKMALPEAKNQ